MQGGGEGREKKKGIETTAANISNKPPYLSISVCEEKMRGDKTLTTTGLGKRGGREKLSHNNTYIIKR